MLTGAQWDELVLADKSLRDYLKRIVHERRSTPCDYLISAFDKNASMLTF
jgi:hypothetical protein